VYYPAIVGTFPLHSAFQSRLAGANFDFATVSGTCSGNASVSNAPPASASFDGIAAVGVVGTTTMNLTGCSVSLLLSTSLTAYDGNGNLLGHATMSEFGRSAGAPEALPATVKVGDSAVYGRETLYADSSKQAPSGSRELSYIIEADGAQNTSAIANLVVKTYDTAARLLSTQHTRYRIAKAGAPVFLSDDTQYSTTSSVHVLLSGAPVQAQPTGLALLETVIGTGTQVAVGKTLSVNYTLWLYNATAPGLKGAQADTSAGRGPFSFTTGAGQVIPGFEVGFSGMKVGGKRTIIIPSALGYGTSGSGSIPPNAGLVFDVELMGVK
jgi:FKBP-type peptidyl-prolyl cis-trans isomerase